MSKTAKGQSAADTLNYMKEGIGLTKMQKEKLKKFLVEEAEDIGMTSRHANKKSLGIRTEDKKLPKTEISDAGKKMMVRARRMASGGEVHMDDSPNSGMITTKGFGASRKT
jgi:hypothetical protein